MIQFILIPDSLCYNELALLVKFAITAFRNSFVNVRIEILIKFPETEESDTFPYYVK